MSDLIDREKIGLTDFDIIMCDGNYKTALEMLINKINEAPTVDAVQVVRCKDCIHGIDRQNLTVDGEWITLYCPVIRCKRVGSMFCSEGKRNDDE